MLFNSYTFLFVFLPAVLIIYAISRRIGNQSWSVGILIVASLLFYGWWSVPYLGLLVGSILGNFVLGRGIADRASQKKTLLWIGIAANLGLLGYFKYANFFIDEVNRAFGVALANDTILLPLAISFFTFQQIAYLVDCYHGKAVRASFAEYSLFVAFFPQLIAGPIVRSTEVLPQIQKIRLPGLNWGLDFAPGITLFTIGLAKKVLLADPMALYATPIFGAADSGVPLTFVEAWIGALAYTFQLYFDFSGYSDMAIGLARMFGIRLPANFESPYRATSIAAFWRRWHITLSRFLREYLYIPLGGNRKGPARQSTNLLITMVLGGIWHGAGWTFFVWGGLHGIYLVINQWWGRQAWPEQIRHKRLYTTFAWLLTFTAVVVGWVFFRAESLAGALAMLQSMFGFDGFNMPRDYMTIFPILTSPAGVLRMEFVGDQILWQADKVEMAGRLLLAAAVVLCLPNTAQLFGLVRVPRPLTGSVQPLRKTALPVFNSSPLWLGATLILMVASLFAMTNVSEFLYYQF